MKGDKHFFSYSRTDSSDFTLKLAKDLKERGFNIWLDQLDIKGGTLWDVAIQKALNEADCMIVVLSESSVNSVNVLDEVSYALKNKKRVVPLLTEDCNIPFRLDRIQHVDFRRSYNRGLEDLIKTLDDTVHTEPLPPVPEKKSNKKWFLISGAIALLAVILFLIFNKNSNSGSTGITNIDTAVLKPDTTKPEEVIEDKSGSSGEQTKEEQPKILFISGDVKGAYEVTGNSLILYITCPALTIPSVQFDVNQNKTIDPYIDRAYGLMGDDRNKICPQYVLTNNSTTPCGGALTNGLLTVSGDLYTFTFPLAEVNQVAGSRTVSFQINIFYGTTVTWIHFPQRNDYIDFNKVYEISI